MTESEIETLKSFLCSEDIRVSSDRESAFQACCTVRGAYSALMYHDACIRYDYFERIHSILDTLLHLYP